MERRCETAVSCSQTVLEHNPLISLFEAIEHEQSNPGLRLCCVHCQAAITTEKEGIEVCGSHTFRVTNPAGFEFNLACFKHAWGCGVYGAATTLHSWFSGYSWRYACCLGCEAQLGWCYTKTAASDSSDAAFFGLITDKLLAATYGD